MTEAQRLARGLGERALAAARRLAPLPSSARDAFLLALADALGARTPEILAANARDLEAGRAAGLSPAMLDRLRLDPKRIGGMIEGVRQVAALPDPLGTVLRDRARPDGLRVRQVRVPLGVVGVVYESRPNVTIDCTALAVKAGNAIVLRGGKEAIETNRALAAIIADVLPTAGLPADAVQLVGTPDREVLAALLRLDDCIHCLIPRGGEGLIRFVAENATVPVLKHYKGVCHLFLDVAADPAKAERIVVNAKAQRPSACNALEILLVHEAVAAALLPRVGRALVAAGVRLKAEPRAAAHLAAGGVASEPATDEDFRTEFLDLVLAVKVVAGFDEALACIHRDGSQHSDGIVTEDEATARRFLAEVDTAAAFWNASTRFHDGFEFGLGAEIGISTDRLHARGPMGLEELCTTKWIVTGDGHVRG